MIEAIKEFQNFLKTETQRLEKIRDFLITIPGRITTGQVTGLKFQSFLENYELETYKFQNMKMDHIKKLSEVMNIPEEDISFHVLVKMGYEEFLQVAPEFINITNQIKSLLLKTTIFIKNFMNMNQQLMRLNNFLLQKDYSNRGKEKKDYHSYSFQQEA